MNTQNIMHLHLNVNFETNSGENRVYKAHCTFNEILESKNIGKNNVTQS